MKKGVLFLFLFLILFESCINVTAIDVLSHEQYLFLFQRFMFQFTRTYHENEVQSRFAMFKDNLNFIMNHNSKKNQSVTLAVNHLADWTKEEVRARYLGYLEDRVKTQSNVKLELSSFNFKNPLSRIQNTGNMILQPIKKLITDEVQRQYEENKDLIEKASNALGFSIFAGVNVGSLGPINQKTGLPLWVDWRNKTARLPDGAVTSVKDQGSCGSCWAFSAVGAMEGAHAIRTKKLISLSAKQVLDCSKAGSCAGGSIRKSYEYIIHSKGICAEADYPYSEFVWKCASSGCKPAAQFSNFIEVPQLNEHALQVAVATGPVSVAVDADSNVFHFYHSGVLDHPSCGTRVNHAMLIVGYDTLSPKPYWIVKNQWGLRWGDLGYIRIAMGVPSTNQCGITTHPMYPIV